ncbi:unnamed protein product [Alopecurus aequalis]
MNRRFVNLLVVDKWRAPRPAVKLHRIDPASLFHPAGSAEPTESAPAPGRLPSAAISFDWPCKRHHTGWMDFMAFNNNSVVAVDHEGHTLLYDHASRAVLAANPMLPALQSNSTRHCSRLVWFYALIYGNNKPPDLLREDDWYWRSLKLPPFYYTNADDSYCSDADDDYTDDRSDDEPEPQPPHPCDVSAFTVVGESQIWVSTVGAGTYSFDTVSREWSKVGEWALPFRGRAVHVPEHSLWFGASDQGYHELCAVDLAAKQPVQHMVWEDPPPPVVGSLTLTATSLLPLGSGRVCVARLFHETEREDETVAVVTGVEVRRGVGMGNLQIIKHKSRHFSFGERDQVRLL